ncbi:MAG: hypothetical protein Q4A04_08240 [Eubacteriales bacterium]|nr:hypothetical protein [Eubacteriales bacterium]
MAFDKTEYMKQYQKEKLKRVPLNLLPEEYEELKSVCEQSGDTVQGFIKMAILYRIMHYHSEGYANNPEAEEINEKEKQYFEEEGIDIEVPRLVGYDKLHRKRDCKIVCDLLQHKCYFHETPESLSEKIEENAEARWMLCGINGLPRKKQADKAHDIWRLVCAKDM